MREGNSPTLVWKPPKLFSFDHHLWKTFVAEREKVCKFVANQCKRWGIAAGYGPGGPVPGTPKGPHLIQSTLWDHPNIIAAPSPLLLPPDPDSCPLTFHTNYNLTLPPTDPPWQTPDTHLRHTPAHTRHWHLEGFVSDLTEDKCPVFCVIVSKVSIGRVGHLNSTDTRPGWKLGPRPARPGLLAPSSRPGSASFYLHFKCVQNWNNPSLITQPAETSGPFHMRINFLWCSILETGLLTVSDFDSFSSEIAALKLLWQLSRQMGNWNTFCDDYKSNQPLNRSLHNGEKFEQ